MDQIGNPGKGTENLIDLAQLGGVRVVHGGLDNRGLMEYDSSHGAFLLFLVLSMSLQPHDTLRGGKSPYFFACKPRNFYEITKTSLFRDGN
jgi:hypothetical protein